MTNTNDHSEITELRQRLEEAEETIRAIRSGTVDAFVVEVPDGARVYTLESADRPYRLLVEKMQQGAITLSNEGAIAYCNRHFADLVERPLERLIGIAFRDFMPTDAQTVFENLLQQSRAGFSQGESHVQKASGGLIPVFLTFNALPPDCGAAVGLIVTDLTTQRHHEKLKVLLEALKEADHRKNEFLAMLAHELRGPLAPIANAVKLLGFQQENERPTHQRARCIIERQLGQLQHLVDDLLEMSRITTGKVQLRREPVAVSDIVEGAVESVRTLIEQKRHELTVSLPPEPIWLHADAARLEQVLINLLTNAAKFTEENGHVWLTVEPANYLSDGIGSNTLAAGSCPGTLMARQPSTTVARDPPLMANLDHDFPLSIRHKGSEHPTECIIRVRDTGVGISAALLPCIFDLFTQAERSLDRSQGGLGIGLALVQRLTVLHGGTVEASSILGTGSEFVLRLPVLSGDWPMANDKPNIPSTRTIRPLRVLLVDDNADTILSFSMLLVAFGHDVRTAHDGLTGIQVALDYKPDVALLDIGLPGLNGHEVARRIRMEPTLKNVVLIAMTGYGQDSDRLTSLNAGFNHHLVKPARFEDVKQILATISVPI